VVIFGFPDMSEERIEKDKSAVDAADHYPATESCAIGSVVEADAGDRPNFRTHPEHARASLVWSKLQRTSDRHEETPEHLKRLIARIKTISRNFEASHPKLAAFVNEYSTIYPLWASERGGTDPWG